jgi:hypothetical protein
VVIGDLSSLRGPVSGTVELPHRLFWYPERIFDLSDRASLMWMYQVVLREATTAEELQEWLDRTTLTEVWPTLFLPLRLRQAWEAHHPHLR